MTESPSARRSAGEWLFQLTTITIGVLIALSFDAVLRWSSDRALLTEAKQTIAQEVAANRAAIERHVASLPGRIEKFDAALKLVDDLLAGAEISSGEVELSVSLPELSDAGWQTAERTGALSLMGYADVQRLARVYSFQSLFERQAQGALEPLTKLQAWFAGERNPLTSSPQSLASLRAMILDFRGTMHLHQQLSEQLSATYAAYTDTPQ
jgi:hypothetical protein